MRHDSSRRSGGTCTSKQARSAFLELDGATVAGSSSPGSAATAPSAARLSAASAARGASRRRSGRAQARHRRRAAPACARSCSPPIGCVLGVAEDAARVSLTVSSIVTSCSSARAGMCHSFASTRPSGSRCSALHRRVEIALVSFDLTCQSCRSMQCRALRLAGCIAVILQHEASQVTPADHPDLRVISASRLAHGELELVCRAVRRGEPR